MFRHLQTHLMLIADKMCFELSYLMSIGLRLEMPRCAERYSKVSNTSENLYYTRHTLYLVPIVV